MRSHGLDDTSRMSNALKKPAAPKDAQGDNRRRSARTPHIAEAWISSPSASTPDDKVEVTSLNISRHGVAFENTQPLALGAFYVIEVGVGEQRLCSEIRIFSCRENAGFYDIGA